ncbi:MAG: EAL domain-containing protein [Hylemonella sp.]
MHPEAPVSASDDPLLFADETAGGTMPAPLGRDSGEAQPWTVLVVDDDQGVHEVTRLVLGPLRFRERPLRLLHARSAAEARALLAREPDVAVLLLDVVMESDQAGLELVQHVRGPLGRLLTRIILRTGQPGQAPEARIITEYDINDYREKAELTAQKLVTAVTAALRGYDDLLTIQSMALRQSQLEALVQERTAALSETNRRLRHQQALLAEAQQIAQTGHFEWHLERRSMQWSLQLYALLGLDPQQVQPDAQTLLQAVPQEERAQLRQLLERACASGQGYALQHRVCRPDGSVRIVFQRVEVGLDGGGHAIRLAGIVQDITERHQAEERMRKLSTAVEQTADAVMITDAAGRIEYVNAAFCRMSGYSAEEVLGQTPRLLKSGQMPEIFYRRMWHAIADGQVFADVMINRRKDGSLFHSALTITPQRNAQGAVTHYIATARDISEQIRYQERIQHLAHHDALTDLPNRALLLDRLDQALARAKWRQRLVAVLFLDLDRFKVINDSLGHASGDALLKAMAQRLRACVRDGDTVARLGGDEFAIVLNDVAAEDDVAQVAQGILQTVGEPFPYQGRELFVTTSIGISLFPRDGQDSHSLLKRADVAMYNAKDGGKSAYRFYTAQDEARQLARLSLETDLRRALQRDEFFLVFQPQVEAGSGRIVSVEALLRWQRQGGEVVSPGEFVGLLEETGMILAVGDWVLRKACAEAQALRACGVELGRVAVNVSLHQFRQRQFVARVREILANTGLPPALLELEITEGVLADDVHEAIGVLRELDALGVRLSIDDFGTGYASMSHLRQLPFDLIKIDKSFVEGLPGDREHHAIVTAIITLARSLQMEVVAEGVETQQQFECVRDLGCQLVQGYYFSPPLLPHELRRGDGATSIRL